MTMLGATVFLFVVAIPCGIAMTTIHVIAENKWLEVRNIFRHIFVCRHRWKTKRILKRDAHKDQVYSQIECSKCGEIQYRLVQKDSFRILNQTYGDALLYKDKDIEEEE